MLARDFYQTIATDESTIAFLRSKNLLPDPKIASASNKLRCKRCGTVLKQTTRKKALSGGTGRQYLTMRCPKFGCQTFQSIRAPNKFFTYTDLNGRCNSHLSLGHILELVYYWSLDIPQLTVAKITGHNKNTVCDWFNLCRDVCVDIFETRNKLGGNGGIVEIDECLLRGKRKNNRGRLLLADQGKEAAESRKRNYGKRIEGPWVFGLCWKHNAIFERRYFIVEKRDKKTLIPIIQQEVEITDTTIRSDEWRAYSSLKHLGYNHQTVNHKKSFINPSTKAHTQNIECAWAHLKFRLMRRMHGTRMLDRHLKEMWWRSISDKDSWFNRILEDIRSVYT